MGRPSDRAQPATATRSRIRGTAPGGRRSWRTSSRPAAISPRGEPQTKSASKRRQETWKVCQDAAFELIEFPGVDNSEKLKEQLTSAARRVCLCFEQQMLADDTRKLPRTSRRILARVLAESQL